MFKKYPIFLSDHLLTKRRGVAVARVVAAARRDIIVARRVVARPMTSCCRRLPTHPPMDNEKLKLLLLYHATNDKHHFLPYEKGYF